MEDKYDNRLFSILEEVKSLPNFLDVIFGFLYRRTDYFQISSDAHLGVGLPDGVAQKLLWQAFKKYEGKQREDTPTPAPSKQEIAEVRRKSPEERAAAEKSAPSKGNTSEGHLFETYNGAVFENYAWSQSISDVDIQIKIPDKVSCKQLLVDVASAQLTIQLKGTDTVYLTGDLCKKCKMNETVWSLDGHILQIHLEKQSESWWDCLLQSEPRLNFNKMDCTRPFHELSDEARAKIEQLTWDQQRRQQGLPTSDQMHLEQSLRKAWNAEGSPFTGEYDPSKVALG